MNIQITYKLLDNAELFRFDITPQNYFDLIANNENFENHGVAKFNNAKEYLIQQGISVPLDHLEYTLIEISNSIHSDHSIKTNYFGAGQSEVTYRKDKSGFELIIQSFKIATNSIHITRMERNTFDSDWKISSSIGLNYEKKSGEEIWYSATKGEFIHQTLTRN
jgi:hypothetical protein